MKKKLSVAAVASVVMFIVLRIQGSELKTPISKKAIVDLEFADTVKRVQELFAVWNLQTVKINVWIDFLFIIAYVSFLSLAAKATAAKLKMGFFKQAGIFFSRLAFVAGLLDVCENIFMLQTAAGNYTSVSLTLTFYCATFKFIFAALIILYLLIALTMLKKK
ncbi:MAG TPA: hypothetical protein VHP12_07805 [Chitinophagaceae bacterium]|nr:hypothetical protein [Chitinophagaceae bacterium]